MSYFAAMSRVWSVCARLIGLLVITGCRGESPERQNEQRMPVSQTTSLSAADLLDRISPYYPHWDPEKESLNDYLERYHQAPEFLALRRVSAHALEHNDQWRAFLRDVRTSFPGYFIQDAIPPWDTIPSYQVVIGYEYPHGSKQSKYLVFRLSYFAPVYDYHESDRDETLGLVKSHRTPTPEAAPVAGLVAAKITQDFGYRMLDPGVGATPVPDIHVGTLFPGEATLADALFGESPTW